MFGENIGGNAEVTKTAIFCILVQFHVKQLQKISAAKKLDTEFYSFEEYLTLEVNAENKNEFHDGRIYAMSGGTFRHEVIANNVGSVLRDAAKEKKGKCIPTNSNLKVYINPILIVEVLSKNTAAYDRGEKFRSYQQRASFKEYLIVSQEQPKVECFYREEENLWRISYAVGLDKSIHLHSLDCEIPLTEIYVFIEFEDGIQTELDL